MPRRPESGGRSPRTVPQQSPGPPNAPLQLCPCWGARRRYNNISDGGDEEDDYAGGKGGYTGRRRRSGGSYQQQQQQQAARQRGGSRLPPGATANTTVRACVYAWMERDPFF